MSEQVGGAGGLEVGADDADKYGDAAGIGVAEGAVVLGRAVWLEVVDLGGFNNGKEGRSLSYHGMLALTKNPANLYLGLQSLILWAVAHQLIFTGFGR